MIKDANQYKTISLPRLNKLKPTITSTLIKLAEEMGELAEAVGKYQGLNGEKVTMPLHEVIDKICEELLDCSQTCTTLMFQLEEEYGVNVEEQVSMHIQKLKRKNYMD